MIRLPRTVRTAFALMRPLRSIAKDLHRLADLVELELASRTPPLWLPSQDPRTDDTQVRYYGERDDRKPWRKWFDWHDDADQAQADDVQEGR